MMLNSNSLLSTGVCGCVCVSKWLHKENDFYSQYFSDVTSVSEHLELMSKGLC